MNKSMSEKLYHPLIYFFLLPIFSLLLGSLFALQYHSLNYISLMALYLFVLINQMLENVMLRIPTDDFTLSKTFLITLEIFNFLLILFFGWRHSWLAALVLLLYTLIIQLQFLFSYYHLDEIARLVATFLKIILLNVFSFYIHTHFIHYRFLPYYFGLFVPFFLYEVSRLKRKPDNKIRVVLIGLGYAVNIALLWSHLQYRSLILLVTLPFAGVFKDTFNRKTTATFSILFSIIYIALTAYAFLG